MKKITSKFLFCLFLLFFLVACGNKKASINDFTNTEGSKSYPSPIQVSPQETNFEHDKTYPSIDNAGGVPYPPVEAPTQSGPEFHINGPVLAGSVQVTGTGPANVTINLIDVSEMGLFLAETTIDSNGQFTFDLSTPLIKSHSIGLQIGNLSNTDYDYDDFIYSENYIDRPFIGIILDMVTVE